MIRHIGVQLSGVFSKFEICKLWKFRKITPLKYWARAIYDQYLDVNYTTR